MKDGPLVSIGVPVYNDAPWLRNALDHILTQEYQNLEIIIADDGSTDGSREICREYARLDKRVRYFENKHNLGALGNHVFVFDVSSGDYFAWGSGHDYYLPSFICQTLERLMSNSSIVMCCTQAAFLNEKGDVVRITKGGLNMKALPPVKRFRALLEHVTGGGTAFIYYGLYRQEVLAKAGFSKKQSGFDVILLANLSLLGEIAQVNEVLLNRVLNHKESNRERAVRQAGILSNTSAFNIDKLMPYFSASWEFIKMAMNSKLAAVETETLFLDIIELDVNLGRKAMEDEFVGILQYARQEATRIGSLAQIRKFRAAQVLTILFEAYSLGLEVEDLYSAMKEDQS